MNRFVGRRGDGLKEWALERVLKKRHVVLAGASAELRENPALAAYLGV